MMDTFFKEETINYARVSECVSKLLQQIAVQFHQQLNSGEFKKEYIITEYDSHQVPEIQVFDYLRRIASMSMCANRDIISALVYIDRLTNNEVISGISFHNIHRLLAVSIMVSTKFYQDQPLSNRRWAHILGIPLRELNKVEVNFLQSLKYDLNLRIEELLFWTESIFRYAEVDSIQERQDFDSGNSSDTNCIQTNQVFCQTNQTVNL